MNFYRVANDNALMDKWVLGTPRKGYNSKCNHWSLISGKKVKESGPFIFPIAEEGPLVDFNVAAFGVPVLSARVVGVLKNIAPRDIQIIPAHIDSPGINEQFNVLVATKQCGVLTTHRAPLSSGRREMAGQI
jgi:hypothetical protein